MKEVNIHSQKNFELGSQESTNVRKWIIIGFQPRDRQDSQTLITDTFCSLPVTSAECIIGTKNYPDAAIILNNDDNDLTQGYARIEEIFRALTKVDNLQPILSH